jgi:hypothetical protein
MYDLVDVAAMAAVVLSWQFHGSFLVRQRFNWKNHVATECPYRPLKYTLLEFIHLLIKINLKQSSNASNGRRTTIHEIILHCTLRYLCGGSYHDIFTTAGMSRSSFYNCIYHGTDAINNCLQIKIDFHLRCQECIRQQQPWRAKATTEFCMDVLQHNMVGCVGSGCLQQMRQKKMKEYFSGTISALGSISRLHVMYLDLLPPCQFYVLDE